MNKLRFITIRHAASMGISIAFLMMALASTTLFIESEEEGPCNEITPITVNYTITVNVRDDVTGNPIPDATVNVNLVHKRYTYLGSSICQTSPPVNTSLQAVLYTDASGVAVYTSPALTYNVDIDRSYLYIMVEYDGYNTDKLSKPLYPETLSYLYNFHIINLTDQP